MARKEVSYALFIIEDGLTTFPGPQRTAWPLLYASLSIFTTERCNGRGQPCQSNDGVLRDHGAWWG
jgi:hypothetical protein